MNDFSLFSGKYYAIYPTWGFNEAKSLISKLFFIKYFTPSLEMVSKILQKLIHVFGSTNYLD